LSAVVDEHCTQATAPIPQLPNCDVSQLAPEQHPVPQFDDVQPVHTPATQFWSVGHIEQLEPPVPHIPVVLPSSHTLPLQQPLGHDVLLHTHAPPTHTCPALQTAPVPHSHAPPLEQAFALAPHLTHPTPAVPHAAADGVSQTLPLQQPVGHELALHTHMPPAHAWPAAQAGPEPQEHVPSVQPSASARLHATQLAPVMPQAPLVGIVHVAPWQHPAGQDFASQTHAPPTHSCPATHGEPVPHWHMPIAEQLSVFLGSQTTHASPPKPHAPCDRALHVGPEQHPVAHVAAHPEQAPPAMHVSPVGQLSHMLPPLPQAPPVLPAWQVLLRQQPVPHETPSHVHCPLRHRCPAPQALPVPHMHTPADEQLSADPGVHAAHAVPCPPHAPRDGRVHEVPSQHPLGHEVASHTQTSCAQWRPALHGALLPHLHRPVPEHVLASSGSHAMQLPPPEPQVESECSSQVCAAEQHPLGQLVASHTQSPPTHRCPSTQGLFPPQLHVPVDEQPSPEVALHATQAAPPAPHVETVCGWHVRPEQHPDGH
jgi:hypothetical protein